MSTVTTSLILTVTGLIVALLSVVVYITFMRYGVLQAKARAINIELMDLKIDVNRYKKLTELYNQRHILMSNMLDNLGRGEGVDGDSMSKIKDLSIDILIHLRELQKPANNGTNG